MKSFPKKTRDKAMRIICDYYADQQLWPLNVDDLRDRGLPKGVDANRLAYVLESMGYVQLTRFYDSPSEIELTDAGRCYFELNADRLHEKRVELIRYIITTAIAVAALVKAFLPEILEFLGRL